jgi:electron transfer flavoprotein alpha subunit
MAKSLYLEEAKGVWVYIEHENNEIEPVSLELLGKGREIADKKNTELVGILLGDKVKDLANEIIARGADKVIVVEHPYLKTYTTGPYTKVISELIVSKKPDIFLFGATRNGVDLAGRAAVRVRTGLNAHCTELEINEKGLLIGWVPGFGGGIAAGIKCENHRPQMSTVRPGIFRALEPDRTRKGEIEEVKVELTESDCTTTVIEQKLLTQVDISKAERIVAIGGGVQGKLELVKELANLLHAEIGATRVATDAGWVEKERMIGQTGVTTRPKLVICLGISGATQFTIGIDKAETVIAINIDEGAPIFDHADYYIVDDLFKILPELVKELKIKVIQKE